MHVKPLTAAVIALEDKDNNCDPVWENRSYRLFKSIEKRRFKYLMCCSLQIVEAMCTKF